LHIRIVEVVTCKVCCDVVSEFICIFRSDVGSVSELMTVTCALPFTSAGCDALHSTAASNDSTRYQDLLSCASKTLLLNTSQHVASFKLVLASLSQLVSLS